MKKLLVFIVVIFIVAACPNHCVGAQQSKYILKVYPGKNIYQGNSVIITAITPVKVNKALLKIKVFNKGYGLYPVKGNKYRLPLGISMKKKPGKYKVALYYGRKQKAAFFLTVLKKPFRMTSIRLSKKSQKLATSQSLIYESNMIGKLFRTVKTKFFYGHSQFNRPTWGTISSGFGVGRKYLSQTSKLVSTWRHKGVDFANKEGTPIYAANDGEIILSREFEAHGGTIMIDHGQRIISIYTHVIDIIVKEGEQVKRGQKVASMGSSGISTGPHLHWGLSVSNVRVNPLQWVDNNMLR